MKKLLFIVLLFSCFFIGCKEQSDIKIEIEENYYLNLNSTDDLVIKCSGVSAVNDFIYNGNEVKNIVINSKGIVISNLVITKYGYGEFEGSFKVAGKKYSFKVNVIDNRLPELVSESKLTYRDKNLVLKFKLYGGNVVALSGDGINESSYLIEDDIVTIYAQTIELLTKESNIIEYTLSYIDINTNKITEVKGEVIIEKKIFGDIIWG